MDTSDLHKVDGEPLPTANDVKKFLGEGTNHLGEPIEPVSMSEFSQFWKDLTDDEKFEFKSGIPAVV